MCILRNQTILTRILNFLLLVLVLGACDKKDADVLKEQGIDMQPFLPGQVWKYETREGEEDSRIIICLVEEDPKLGQIVHIHVANVRMKNKSAPNGFTSTIWHMPYDADALRDCLVELEQSNTETPPYQDGYRLWREAFDKSEGGIWTIPVSESISTMETMMSN